MNRDFIVPGGGNLKIVTVYNGNPNSYEVNIDVKKIISNYNKLSVKNFGITFSRVYTPYGAVTSGRGPYINIYNANTGMLNVSTSGETLRFTDLTVVAWYV